MSGFRGMNPGFILLKKHLLKFMKEREARRSKINSKKEFEASQLKIAKVLKSEFKANCKELRDRQQQESEEMATRHRNERGDLAAKHRLKRNVLRRRAYDYRNSVQSYRDWAMDMWSKAFTFARIASMGGRNPKKQIKQALRDLKADD